MLSKFCQIYERRGEISGLRLGEQPIINIKLRHGERIISVNIEEIKVPNSSRRKTRDWVWSAYIEWSVEI